MNKQTLKKLIEIECEKTISNFKSILEFIDCYDNEKQTTEMYNYSKIQELFGTPLNIVPRQKGSSLFKQTNNINKISGYKKCDFCEEDFIATHRRRKFCPEKFGIKNYCKKSKRYGINLPSKDA